MLLNIPKSFASNVLPPQQTIVTPLFSQDILQELQSGLTQIPMETLFCPWTMRYMPPAWARTYSAASRWVANQTPGRARM